jgi:hypothetical protein
MNRQQKWPPRPLRGNQTRSSPRPLSAPRTKKLKMSQPTSGRLNASVRQIRWFHPRAVMNFNYRRSACGGN